MMNYGIPSCFYDEYFTRSIRQNVEYFSFIIYVNKVNRDRNKDHKNYHIETP